ncbi:MAG: NAD(+)/NADH kinase [Verrucomicrobiales bacterium]
MVVYKKSAWELFRSSKDPHVALFMQESGRDAQFFEHSHQVQKTAIETVKSVLTESGAKVKMLYRSELSETVTRGIDLAVTIGGDGTFLETSHFIDAETPILGVNSDPLRSVGFLSACDGPEFPELFTQLSNLPKLNISRAQAIINGNITGPPILNDILFSSPNPAATTRYRIGEQLFRNSGFLVATAAGSTAWIFQEGGTPLPLEDKRFQSYHCGNRGSLPAISNSITLKSLTRKGRLYIDGEHISFPLSIGQTLELQTGPSLTVIGDLEVKRKKFLTKYPSLL